MTFFTWIYQGVLHRVEVLTAVRNVMRRIFLLFLFRFNWRDICFHIYSYFSPLWSLTEVKLIYFRGGGHIKISHFKEFMLWWINSSVEKIFFAGWGEGGGWSSPSTVFCVALWIFRALGILHRRRNRWGGGAKGEGLAPTFFFWQI